jgi:hypothetical protein
MGDGAEVGILVQDDISWNRQSYVALGGVVQMDELRYSFDWGIGMMGYNGSIIINNGHEEIAEEGVTKRRQCVFM